MGIGGPQLHTGPEPRPAGRAVGTTRVHLLVAILLAALTIVAFVSVGGHLLPVGWLIPLLLVLAAAQVCMQLLYYMRLKWDRRIFALLFGGGVALAVLIVLAVHAMLSL